MATTGWKSESGVAHELLDACGMLQRGPVVGNQPSDPVPFRSTTASRQSESKGLRFGFFVKPLPLNVV